MSIKTISVALSSLLLFEATSVEAQSFVDLINSEVHPEGQQVIYEMNVGAFTPEGTFVAASQRLAELKQLGVDIVWLMPIYPRGGGINSPYAARDFKAVNPSYGTVSDVTAFVSRAHELGMKVWLDWVPNHTATDATWVTTHPDYYKQQDSVMIHPNNYGDVYQLDYSNPDLVEAMNDCLRFWVLTADIDGYRCDYVSSPEIRPIYWRQTIPMLKQLKPGKEVTMMAEADLTEQTRLQPCGFDYDYAWGFQSRLDAYGAEGSLAYPLEGYCQWLINTSMRQSVGRMTYITNHDQNWNEERKTLIEKYGDNRYLLSVVAYTVWGMPLIYNGQETGGNQALNYFTDTKIDWVTVDAKMHNTLRTLCALKHSQAALHDGKNLADNPVVKFIPTADKNNSILAYSRKRGDSEVLVVINTSASPQEARFEGLQGVYSKWLDSETIAAGVSRKTVKFKEKLKLHIAPKGYAVFVKGNYADE